jgi:hypothetical protein
MAACQTVISVWSAAAAYFQAPRGLLNDRVRLFVVGGAAALIPVLFGLYALSGAGVIRRLPLLRTALEARRHVPGGIPTHRRVNPGGEKRPILLAPITPMSCARPSRGLNHHARVAACTREHEPVGVTPRIGCRSVRLGAVVQPLRDAVAGAMAIVFWTEPVPTYDLDVLVWRPSSPGPIATLRSI